jgi:hypothetical protein
MEHEMGNTGPVRRVFHHHAAMECATCLICCVSHTEWFGECLKYVLSSSLHFHDLRNASVMGTVSPKDL